MRTNSFLKNLFAGAKITIALLFVLVLPIKGFSQPYSIDPTFGPSGLVTGSNCIAGVDVIFSGNKYYMIGWQGLYVINYDGTLDTTFGSNGFLTLPTTTSSYPTYTVKNAKINGGFIYLFGQIQISSTDTNAFIAKFNLTTGTPDTAFGPAGIKTLDYGAMENCTDILFGSSPDASFYVVMNRTVSSSTTYIIKMFADGTLDTSFDPLGYKIYTFQNGLLSGQLFNYQDELLLTGILKTTVTTTHSYEFCIVKLSTDGNIMTNFGTNGVIAVNLWGFTPKLLSSKLTSDNKLYFCYYAAVSSNSQWNSLYRYDLNTNVLTQANHDIPISFGQFSLASDGKVYFPGYDGITANGSAMVRRFNENLTLDTSFNVTGRFDVRFTNNTGPEADSRCRLAYAHDDGKIFVAGTQPNLCRLGARRIVPGVLAIPQFEKDRFSIVPNPVTDFLEIITKNDIEIEKIAIADITGKIVLQRIGNISRIDAQVLQSGLYFLEVYSGNNKSTLKFIKR